jgi:hypothetical protein
VRLQVHAMADSPCALGGDDGGARTEEGIEH